MKKKSKRIRAFLRENRQIYLFALFLTVWLGYFLSSWQERERRMMHCALDDAIPFVPAFIIPYLMWYAYVPLMLAAVCFLDKKYFPRQCAAFFGGAWACIAVLIAFPTAVDFRPDAAGDGVFLWLCRFIFAADRPVNVFPSLHCYEALCVHLTAFSCPRRHDPPYLPFHRIYKTALGSRSCSRMCRRAYCRTAGDGAQQKETEE